MSESRTTAFRRNELLERLLNDLGKDLWPAEKKLIGQYKGISEMQYPLILVMGPLRSGTTLFIQWLANTGLFSYPTNLLSRFYQAPIIGAKIQLLLTDPRYNFRDELGEFLQLTEYESINGKTRGSLAPNEFWYFWRRFLSEPGRDVWTDDELRRTMDTHTMLAEITGVLDVFKKPFVAKGMLFNYNIPFLDSILEKALFVQIKRDPVSNVASVLDARKRQFGTESKWYSFCIPEFEELKNLDPIAQAAGQVSYINRAVSNGLNRVAESRKIIVEYEQLCRDAAPVFYEIVKKLSISCCKYSGPVRFNKSRADKIHKVDAIKAALSSFGSMDWS